MKVRKVQYCCMEHVLEGVTIQTRFFWQQQHSTIITTIKTTRRTTKRKTHLLRSARPLTLAPDPAPAPPSPPPAIPLPLAALVVTRKLLLRAAWRFSSPEPFENREAFVRVSTHLARSPALLAPSSCSTRCWGSNNCAAKRVKA